MINYIKKRIYNTERSARVNLLAIWIFNYANSES